jgi:hypothetical protein
LVGGGQENLTKLFDILRAEIPRQYRRYVCEDGATRYVPSFDSIATASLRESTRLKLLEIYTEYAPEKVTEIDFLLEKYAGKERQLLESVCRKWRKDRELAAPR